MKQTLTKTITTLVEVYLDHPEGTTKALVSEIISAVEEYNKEVVEKEEKIPHKGEGVVQCGCHRQVDPERYARTRNELRAEIRKRQKELI